MENDTKTGRVPTCGTGGGGVAGVVAQVGRGYVGHPGAGAVDWRDAEQVHEAEGHPDGVEAQQPHAPRLRIRKQ